MGLEPDIAESLDEPAPGRATHSRTLGLLVKGKNINEETLLATDYLNHFNEIIMILDMIPMMPECLDDAKAWAPVDCRMIAWPAEPEATGAERPEATGAEGLGDLGQPLRAD